MANFYDDVIIFRRKDEFAGGGGPGLQGANPEEADSDEYDVFVNKRPNATIGWAGDSGVANPGPFLVNEGRDYVVADYPGQQEHAERERELLLTALGRGVGHFEWQCFPCDFDIGDHLTVYRDEQFHDPDYLFSSTHYSQARIDRIGYGCVVEETTFSMTAATVGDGSSATAVGAGGGL